jgi:hypothetical protein
MPLVTYKTIKVPHYLQDLVTIIALFIPLPTEKYTPDFAILEYGFASTIAITNMRLPLMWFVVAIAIIF